MVKLEIIGTESLGVRGLSCIIEYRGTTVLIDPGVALGYTRWGFHPHPVQAVAGDMIREKIKRSWSRADIIVLSHVHGDHVPLYNANPFQLNLYDLTDNGRQVIIVPGEILSSRQRIRVQKIKEIYGERVIEAKEPCLEHGIVKVYGPFNHGLSRNTPVMITLIDCSDKIVHTSDTALLDEHVVETISRIKPDIVITDGPPIYRYLHDPGYVDLILEKACRNLEKISKTASVIIIDHHLLRCDKGYEWLTQQQRRLRKHADILCAAEYMGHKPLLLEAWRRTLYEFFPISNNWFKTRYKEELLNHRHIYRKILETTKNMNKPCEKEFKTLLEEIIHKNQTRL